MLAVLLLSSTSFHLPASSPQVALRRSPGPIAQHATNEDAAKAAWLAKASGTRDAAPAAAAANTLIPGKPVLTLEAADQMSNVALNEAVSMGITVSVVVMDPHGRTVVQKTMIGTPRLFPDFAIAKANLCMGFHCSSRELRDKYINDQGIGPKMPQALAMGTAAAAANQPIATFPGGVVCRDAAGNVVCAIAVSGASSDEDEHCAILGAQAVGLVTDPAVSQLA